MISMESVDVRGRMEPTEFRGFQGTLWKARFSMDLIEFHGTPWCLMESTESMEIHGFDRIPSTPGISIVCLGFHGSPWIQKNITDSTETHEIHAIPMVPWSFLKVYGAPLFLKSYMKFIELHTDCTEVHGTHGIPWEPRSSWNPYKTGNHGVPDQRFHGILWNRWASMKPMEFHGLRT